MAKIEDEIQQKRFRNESHKAFVNILFTSSWLTNQIGAALKEHKISAQQFNVLRILRGAAPQPTSVKDIISKMLDKMSNASRLVDKLERKGYVQKSCSLDDRRRMDVVITEAGLDCINRASVTVEARIDELFDSINEEQVQQLNLLMDHVRK